MSKPDMILFLSDSRGVYIPRDFADSIKRECLTGVKDEDLEILKSGPDHEWYWEAWQDILDKAVVTSLETGVKYTVYQDGDCWLIPEGMEWNEETDSFDYPEDRQQDEEDEDEES